MTTTEQPITAQERETLLQAEHEQRLFAETLADVTLTLTSQMNHSVVLNEILRQVQRLVPYQTAHIVLLEGENLRIAYWQGYQNYGSEKLIANLVQPLSDFPLDAEVIRSRQPLLIPDTHRESRWVVQPETAWVRSHIVFPISLGERVLGLLRLDADTPHAFSEKTMTYLRPLINAAAIALENARLYEQAQQEITERKRVEQALTESVQQLEMAFNQAMVYAEELKGEVVERKNAEKQIRRRNRELALLNRVIIASARGVSEGSILDIACRELALVFDVPEAVSILLDDQKSTATIIASCLAQDSPPIRITQFSVADDPTLQYLLEGKVPLVVDNIESSPRLQSIRPWLQEHNIVSLLMLPLMVDNEIVGCLSLRDVHPRRFSSDEVDLAWRVADQVSGALARARWNKQRRQLSTAIEQSTEGVIITTANGSIAYVNPAFERITQYTRAEVINQDLIALLKSEKHPPDFYQKVRDAMHAGRVWQGRLTSRKKDGSHFVGDTVIAPIRNERGEIVNYISSQRDVTRELQLENQYYQAEKMNAIGRLTGGIAHDFNNLLTAINGFAESIKMQITSGDPLYEYADKIGYTVQRATDLIDQLMSFSRREATNPQVVDLNKVVANISKMLDPIIGRDIALETNFALNLWPVKIDPTQIEQIVVNLAVNARDAMPNGGRLKIGTSNVVLSNGNLASQETQSGEYVLLSVSDTGMGMADDVKAHIFEPFFTTKEKGRGTGLGLATIFGIVKQSKGHIEVESELGKGTTFNIYLPRVYEKVTHVPKRVQANELPRGTETVLVVEDEPAVRNLAVRLLGRYGYTVLEAEDGAMALEVAQSHHGALDVLLTDMIMPELGGVALADKLRNHYPDLKVLIMSGQVLNTKLRRNLQARSTNFIQKPFSAVELIRKVRATLDG